MKLTHVRLLEALDYDRATGVFRHRETKTSVKAGSVAGSQNDGNYQRIYIDGVSYKSHHLAWFYVTGGWPKLPIDHVDTNKRNNAFENLRQAEKWQNGANIGLKSHNTSGYKGVSWWSRGRKWKAQIQVRGKKHFLGHHATPEAAHEAYKAAAAKFYGEYARVA